MSLRTVAESLYASQREAPKASKYHNRKTTVEGYTFDSVAESRRYSALRLMQMGGAISGLTVHPVYVLQDTFKQNGRTYRAITYEADFAYFENGRIVVEDLKGFRTEVFRIKEKLFRKLYPHLELRIVNAARRQSRK